MSAVGIHNSLDHGPVSIPHLLRHPQLRTILLFSVDAACDPEDRVKTQFTILPYQSNLLLAMCFRLFSNHVSQGIKTSANLLICGFVSDRMSASCPEEMACCLMQRLIYRRRSA